MIKNIIDLLEVSDWHIGDKDIDFAKGINKLPKDRKDIKEKRNMFFCEQYDFIYNYYKGFTRNTHFI